MGSDTVVKARLLQATDALGLSVADTILAALRGRGPMSREEVTHLFHPNK